jgi:hypothetical protein
LAGCAEDHTGRLRRSKRLTTTAVMQEDGNTLIAAGVVFAFGVLFFIWFLGSLRAALSAAEGSVGRLSSIAQESGMLAAICLLLQVAPTVQAALDEDDLSADAAPPVDGRSVLLRGRADLLAMFVAVGVLIMRSRVPPVWLGWVSLAIALLLATIPIGWAGVVWAFPLWLPGTSVLLYLRAPAARDAAAPLASELSRDRATARCRSAVPRRRPPARVVLQIVQTSQRITTLRTTITKLGGPITIRPIPSLAAALSARTTDTEISRS